VEAAFDAPPEPARGKTRWVLRVLLGLVAGACLAVLVFFATLPDVTPLKTRFPATTAFMERRKAELRGAGQDARIEWVPVPLSRISPRLVAAAVAAEDARFYEHAGVDWAAVRGALEKDWGGRNLRHGASTITQQLAKNLYLSPRRTPWRKLREWAIARKLEAALTKRRILELYLNVVELGPRTFGVEAAARRYFGRPAASLSDLEAATLAAVIPSPRLYDPVRHSQRVAHRARQILRAMGRHR
jgi:monofunctional glycosyltransferase